MLIINILIGIDYLDPKLQIWKFGPKNEIFSNFYEIWHSQQTEHANHEYNTRQCLYHSRDYWLIMVIVSE